MIGKREAPIGVFDSGVGGLTVVQQLQRLLPGEDILYFGDTARAPYGCRRPEEIRAFMRQILAYMHQQGVKLAVVACNTMTALGLEEARRQVPFPVIGMDSGVAEALRASRDGRIGAIATAATIDSGKHARDAAALAPEALFLGQACPDFVPLIEQEQTQSLALRRAAEAYLLPLQQAGVQAVVLGCTHYPVIAPLLQELLGPQVTLIDPAAATARAAQETLRRQGLQAQRQAGRLTLRVSGELQRAERLAKAILQVDAVALSQVSMDEVAPAIEEETIINRLEA